MAKRTTITLLQTGGTIKLPGYETSIPGLIVHHEDHKLSWSISHAPSGYRVFRHLRTRRDALAVASRLTVVVDNWDRSMEEMWELIEKARQEKDFNSHTFVNVEERI